jgi:hypothetical protein
VSEPTGAAGAWRAFVDELASAGERLERLTEGLDPVEQADGYRALLRALHNQLGRFEVDRERPELVEFNTWRQKFLMDNPDFRYWVADLRDDRDYRITGTLGDAAYLSITVYTAAGVAEAAATARTDSDGLTFGADGSFAVTLARTRPATGDWLELPEGATSVWVRYFHLDVRNERLGACAIEPIDEPPAPPAIDPARFAAHLGRAGGVVGFVPRIIRASTAEDLAAVNQVRHWSEMTGGAAFTEPGIHYLRGAWELEADEALVVEGDLVECRYWNVLLYSRFLNSLDHRHRTVSRTAATSRTDGGRYRFVLAATDPGPEAGDWLDTEGRRFGIFVIRFLQPVTAPDLPTVRRVPLAGLAG